MRDGGEIELQAVDAEVEVLVPGCPGILTVVQVISEIVGDAHSSVVVTVVGGLVVVVAEHAGEL